MFEIIAVIFLYVSPYILIGMFPQVLYFEISLFVRDNENKPKLYESLLVVLITFVAFIIYNRDYMQHTGEEYIALALFLLFFTIVGLPIGISYKKRNATILRNVLPTIILIFIPLITLFILLSIGLLRYDKGFSGRVIDSETKVPISGAVVAANWNSVSPSPGGAVGSDYKISEVATNNNGEFNLKGAGLVFSVDEPGIVVFKAGYDGLASHQLSSLRSPVDVNKYYNGKVVWHANKATIMLKKLSIEERVHNQLDYGIIASGGKFKNHRKLLDSELSKEREDIDDYKH